MIEGNEHAGEDTRNRPAALRSRSQSSLRLKTIAARCGRSPPAVRRPPHRPSTTRRGAHSRKRVLGRVTLMWVNSTGPDDAHSVKWRWRVGKGPLHWATTLLSNEIVPITPSESSSCPLRCAGRSATGRRCGQRGMPLPAPQWWAAGRSRSTWDSRRGRWLPPRNRAGTGP